MMWWFVPSLFSKNLLTPVTIILLTASSNRYRKTNNGNNSNHHHHDGDKKYHPSSNNDVSIIDKILRPFDLELYQFPDSTGRGIRTTRSRKIGEVLLQVNVSDTLTSDAILEKYPILTRAITYQLDKYNNGNNNNNPSNLWTDEHVLAWGLWKILQEQQQSNDMNSSLKNDKKKQKNTDYSSFYQNYIPLLPRPNYSSILTMPDNIFELWSSCIPRCYRESVISTRTSFIESFNMLCNSLSAVITTTTTTTTENNQQQEQSSIEEEEDDTIIQSLLIPSQEDYAWALSMVRSRSVGIPEYNNLDSSSSSSSIYQMLQLDPEGIPRALIPVLDMINHRIGTKCSLDLVERRDNDDDENQKGFGTSNSKKKKKKKKNKGSNTITTPSSTVGNYMKRRSYWELTSYESYEINDQIYITYGDEKDNWKLLLTYGFVIDDDVDDDLPTTTTTTSSSSIIAFWDMYDLLDICAKIEPNIFIPRIIEQLKCHPQLQQYMQKGEGRAMLSYDIIQNVIRPSLQGGITIMVQIASQIASTTSNTNTIDESILSQKIFNSLIETRKEELQICLERYNKIITKMESNNNNNNNNIIPKEWINLFQSLKFILEQENKFL